MTAIHQFVPSLAPRDAVGAHYLAVQATLRDAGYRSDIYALECKDEYRRRGKPFESFSGGEPGEDTWLLYHCSIGSPVGELVAARTEPLIVDYHNITPASLFARWEPSVSGVLAQGRRQLARLAVRSRLGLADSTFNAHELVDLGYSPTAVVPIMLDLDTLDRCVPDGHVMTRMKKARERGGADWLFVGRIAPNKAQHDVVKAFAAYHCLHDAQARLHLVGGLSSHRYLAALTEFIDALGITDFVDLTGPVSDSALAAYYRSADVLVVCSEHEGFCVPLLEAMHHGLPIVAYGAGAVRETLAGAGLVFDTKEPCTVATAAHHVVTDDRLRSSMIDAGRARLADFDLERSRRRLLDAIVPTVGAPR